MGRHVDTEDLYPVLTYYFKLSWTNRKSEKDFTQAPYLYYTVQSTENYFNKSEHFNTIITTYHLKTLTVNVAATSYVPLSAMLLLLAAENSEYDVA